MDDFNLLPDLDDMSKKLRDFDMQDLADHLDDKMDQLYIDDDDQI